MQQEGLSHGDEGDVVMPAAPGAALVVIDTPFRQHLASILLVSSVPFGGPNQFLPGGFRSEARQPEPEGVSGIFRPLDQQFLKMKEGRSVRALAIDARNANPGKSCG